MRVWVALAIGSTAVGCQNSCQMVCMEMANYARQDCGISVPDAQVADCVSDQRSPDTLERETCKNFGDVATIRTQWTCDDLAVYWDGAGAADEAGP